jgi:hypothetical protein
MRTFLATTLFLFLLVPPLLEAKDPPPAAESFAAFWKEFQRAVEKNDQEAIAALSNVRSARTAALLKEHPFTRAVRRCFATAKPLRDGDRYCVFCGEEIFGFKKVDGAYKFTDIDMND